MFKVSARSVIISGQPPLVSLIYPIADVRLINLAQQLGITLDVHSCLLVVIEQNNKSTLTIDHVNDVLIRSVRACRSMLL